MIAGFFFTMYVARYLEAEGFGIISFAVAFTGIFGILADIGLGPLAVREVARDKTLTAKYLGNIAVLRAILVTFTFGLIALTINLLDYPQQTIRVVYLIGLSSVFGAFNSMFEAIFQAHERMEFVSLGQILNSILLLSGALFAISQQFSVVGIASAYLFARIVTLAYSTIISIWKFARPKIEIDLVFWKQTLSQAWPFALSAAFSTIYYQVDSLMLAFMKGEEVVGWYNAAYRLVLVLAIIPGAYFGAVFPLMSRFYISSKESLRFITEKSFKYLLILAVPIGLGTTLLADKIILLIFGAQYEQSIVALQILAWSMVFIFIAGAFSNLFWSLNKQLVWMKIVGVSVLLNVVLNATLIPKYSYSGSSVATIVTQCMVFALALILSARAGYGIPVRNLIKMATRVAISAGIMSIFVIYLKDFYILAVVPLSALLYFTVLYIIGGIDKEDKLLLRSVVRRSAVGRDI
jgi:O-antigen/teichoic acid export membrane protein